MNVIDSAGRNGGSRQSGQEPYRVDAHDSISLARDIVWARTGRRPDGVMVLSRKGKIKMLDSRAAVLLDRGPLNLLGHRLTEVVDIDFPSDASDTDVTTGGLTLSVCFHDGGVAMGVWQSMRQASATEPSRQEPSVGSGSSSTAPTNHPDLGRLALLLSQTGSVLETSMTLAAQATSFFPETRGFVAVKTEGSLLWTVMAVWPEEGGVSVPGLFDQRDAYALRIGKTVTMTAETAHLDRLTSDWGDYATCVPVAVAGEFRCLVCGTASAEELEPFAHVVAATVIDRLPKLS